MDLFFPSMPVSLSRIIYHTYILFGTILTNIYDGLIKIFLNENPTEDIFYTRKKKIIIRLVSDTCLVY